MGWKLVRSTVYLVKLDRIRGEVKSDAQGVGTRYCGPRLTFGLGFVLWALQKVQPSMWAAIEHMAHNDCP
jgi:hypothetical protein